MRFIELHGSKTAGRAWFTVVDNADYERANAIRWRLWYAIRKNGTVNGPYAQGYVPGLGTICLHTYLTGYRRTDHRNGWGLDNRRENLRDGSGSVNAVHRDYSSPRKTSRFRGVHWSERRRIWITQITYLYEGRSTTDYIGSFYDEEEAARAYDEAAKLRHPGFAVLNFS